MTVTMSEREVIKKKMSKGAEKGTIVTQPKDLTLVDYTIFFSMVRFPQPNTLGAA